MLISVTCKFGVVTARITVIYYNTKLTRRLQYPNDIIMLNNRKILLMQYYKNTELGNIYSVSEGTIRRWIAAAKERRLDLQLHDEDGTTHIANTTKNTQVMRDLVEKGKKHSNTRWHRVVTPKAEFYELHDKSQIADIITNLDIQHELPMKYNYSGAGAQWWNDFVERLMNETEENILNATVTLLEDNLSNIQRLMKDYKEINIIDIGTGNAYPVKYLIDNLLNQGNKINRYIGIDISKEMLDIASKNLKNWFEDRFSIETYQRDITHERFDDLLIDEDPTKTLNLVLLLGGTLQNFRSQDDVLKFIYNSLGRNDIFITSAKLDSSVSRRYFDFDNKKTSTVLMHGLERDLDYLGIDPTLYDVEQNYDAESNMRFSKIRFKTEITVEFKFGEKVRTVNFKKGEAILLWRAWHHSNLEFINLLDKNGFKLLNSSLSNDRQFLLTFTQIESENSFN